MQYYRFVCELNACENIQTVTSSQIAKNLNIDPTQVRKDFGVIGLRGLSRVGFDACEVCRSVRIALGFDRNYEAALLGVGHLGGALLAYSGFTTYGLAIVAAFDKDKEKIGKDIAGCTVKPIKGMKAYISKRGIHMAILTTPAESTQKLADHLVSAGVKAIWNFSPVRLIVPRAVFVRNEHISIGLSEIAHYLKQT
jgi:redox-sensing transcriptional repressor